MSTTTMSVPIGEVRIRFNMPVKDLERLKRALGDVSNALCYPSQLVRVAVYKFIEEHELKEFVKNKVLDVEGVE